MNSGRSPFPGAASFDRGAAIQQQLNQRQLESRLGRVAARHQHAHGGALGAVHIGEGVGLGAGLEQRAGDLDGVGGRLLPIRFDAVGGDVVEQRGAMHRRIETADPAGTGADQSGIAAERVLQPGEVAIDHGLDSGFEFEHRALL